MKLALYFLITLLSFPAFSNSSLITNFLDKVNSGFYIAPYASQMMNASLSTELKNQTPSSDDGEYKYDLSGQRFGIQLGWMLGRFVLGMDGSFSNYDYEYSTPGSSSTLSGEIATNLFGVFVMYRGRKWVPSIGIFLSGDAEDEKNNMKLEDAGGITFGLGYKLAEWLQVNLDVKSYSFTDYTLNGSKTTLPTDDMEKFSATEVAIGVSIPIEFGGKKGRK